VIHHSRTTCRICGEETLHPFLSLGPTPLANSFLRSQEEFATEQTFPLDVSFCIKCSLVQLLDVIDPEVLFRNYIYVTGTSLTMADHHRAYAKTIVELLGLTEQDLVVEVASNDGSLLKCFQPYGVRTLGIEPASNIAELANANGIYTINQFFSSSTADEIRKKHGGARVVAANNVLAHVDDPKDFLIGCKLLIQDDGMIVVEVPYLRNLLDQLQYDTIYHEHHCYFSVTSLMRLCESAGLRLIGIDEVPVHGGSLRMYAAKRETGKSVEDVQRMILEEREAGVLQKERYTRFAGQVAQNRNQLQQILQDLKKNGKSVAAYGAPAKGNTLLNYCKIGTDLVSYTVDKSPHKVGLITPGMHLPVLPVSTLLEKRPDSVLLLSWNMATEIMSQESDYLKQGGQFLIPIPEPRVIS